MPPRSPVRTNIVIFTVLGFVVALLIHFVVLSTDKYDWFATAASGGSIALAYLSPLLGLV